jgi:hypothetical protein
MSTKNEHAEQQPAQLSTPAGIPDQPVDRRKFLGKSAALAAAATVGGAATLSASPIRAAEFAAGGRSTPGTMHVTFEFQSRGSCDASQLEKQIQGNSRILGRIVNERACGGDFGEWLRDATDDDEVSLQRVGFNSVPLTGDPRLPTRPPRSPTTGTPA